MVVEVSRLSLSDLNAVLMGTGATALALSKQGESVFLEIA